MSSKLNNRNVHGVPILTTDATPTIAATIETVNDTIYLVEARIVAFDTEDHNESAGYMRTAMFQNNAGTLTQIGSTASIFTAEVTAGWDVAFSVDGETIRISVTGAADTDISWLVDADVKHFSQYLPNSGVLANA